MNKTQLKTLGGVVKKAEEIFGEIEQLLNGGDNPVVEIRTALEEVYDGLSEKAQEGDKGEANINQRDSLDQVLGAFEQSEASLSEAIDKLKELLGD